MLLPSPLHAVGLVASAACTPRLKLDYISLFEVRTQTLDALRASSALAPLSLASSSLPCLASASCLRRFSSRACSLPRSRRPAASAASFPSRCVRARHATAPIIEPQQLPSRLQNILMFWVSRVRVEAGRRVSNARTLIEKHMYGVIGGTRELRTGSPSRTIRTWNLFAVFFRHFTRSEARIIYTRYLCI